MNPKNTNNRKGSFEDMGALSGVAYNAMGVARSGMCCCNHCGSNFRTLSEMALERADRTSSPHGI